MNLTEYVQSVSFEDFGRPFTHQAQWNPRLRTTGGRFFPKDGHLDFNPKVYELLKEVDGLRFVPPLKTQTQILYLVYQCQTCQQSYQRKRRIDTKRYRCGVCRGKLVILNRPKD